MKVKSVPFIELCFACYDFEQANMNFDLFD